MERLIKDANRVKKANGEMADLSIDSFADVVEAIHIVQDEMGITGTTAEESSKTISGSVSSMKAAWNNLVTELGRGNGDLKKAMDKFVETIVGDENGKGGVLANLLPTVDTIFEGITELVDALVPRLIESIPGIIEKYLPLLTESAMHLVETIISAVGNNSGSLSKSLASAISSIILHAAQNTPALIGSVLDLILALISEIGNNLGTIIPSLITSIINVITEIAKRSSEFTDAAFAIINGIVDAITSPEANVAMVAAGLNLIIALTAGMITAIPDLILNFNKVIETVVENFKNYDSSAVGAGFAESVGGGFEEAWAEVKDKFSSLWQNIVDHWELARPIRQKVWGSVKEFFTNIWDSISGFFSDVWDSVTGFFSEIWGKIQEFLDKPAYHIGVMLGSIVGKIRDFFTITIPNAWNNFTSWLSGVFNGLVETIQTFFTETIPNAWNGLKEKAKELFNSVRDTITTFFTVTIPTKWETFKQNAKTKIDSIKSWFSNLPSVLLGIGTNIVQGLWTGIKNAWVWLKTSVTGLINQLVSGIKTGLGIASPSKVFRDQIGRQMALGLGIGWEDEMQKVRGDIDDSLNFDNLSANIGASIHSVDPVDAYGSFGGTTFGDVIINIDGGNFSSEQSLAEAIAIEIQNMTDRRSSVYA